MQDRDAMLKAATEIVKILVSGYILHGAIRSSAAYASSRSISRVSPIARPISTFMRRPEPRDYRRLNPQGLVPR